MFPKRELGFSANSFNVAPVRIALCSIDEVVDTSKKYGKEGV